MRVLSWNLFHGRAEPRAGRPLLQEFADALAGWSWDVALLQEVPPWWPAPLASRCGATWRSALTSRNQGLPVRRAIASRRPDLLRSNGGGCNAILVRPPWAITAHGRLRLRLRPERRVLHAVRLADPAGGPFDDAWFGNVHAQLGRWDGGAGLDLPLHDLERSTTQIADWADNAQTTTVPDMPAEDTTTATPASLDVADAAPNRIRGNALLIVGGDLNLPRDAVETGLPHDWRRCASSGPDHIVGRGVAANGDSQRPDRGTLSDHSPLTVELREAEAPKG